MNELKVGDPVTRVYVGNSYDALVSHSAIEHIEDGRAYTRNSDGSRHGFSLVLQREGVFWLRGHHAASSSEVAAALTARLLTAY